MIEHNDTLIKVSGDDERCSLDELCGDESDNSLDELIEVEIECSLDELFNRFACSLVVTGIEAENE